MNTEYKYKWMVWAIIILAVMNVATVVTIVYHHHQAGIAELVPEFSQVQSENASVKFSGRYFRDQLNLNSDQMARFKEFNPQFRQQIRDINIDLGKKRHRMLSEMSADNSDTVKLDALSDSIGCLHADLKKFTYRYYMDFKKICDKQQQEKLEQLFGEIFATDVQMGQYGKGGPYGRGRGRRFNN